MLYTIFMVILVVIIIEGWLSATCGSKFDIVEKIIDLLCNIVAKIQKRA